MNSKSKIEEQLKAADALAEAVRDRYGWIVITRRAKEYLKLRLK